MRIGIFAKTFPAQDPETAMRAAAAAGYDGVQYNMSCSGLASMPDEIPGPVAAAIARASALTGQEVFALSATYNMAHPDAEVRRAGLRRLGLMAAACSAMGTRLLTLCTGTRDAADQWRHHEANRTPEAWADMRASVEAALAHAEAHDILLGVEPERANVVDSAQAARRLLGEVRSDRIRIVLDPANLFETAEAADRQRLVEEAVDLLADRIAMAHAKDRAPDGSFATAGRGVIDFGHFLSRLAGIGFDGPVVAHGLQAGEAGDVAAYLRSVLPASGAP